MVTLTAKLRLISNSIFFSFRETYSILRWNIQQPNLMAGLANKSLEIFPGNHQSTGVDQGMELKSLLLSEDLIKKDFHPMVRVLNERQNGD